MCLGVYIAEGAAMYPVRDESKTRASKIGGVWRKNFSSFILSSEHIKQYIFLNLTYPLEPNLWKPLEKNNKMLGIF